LKLAEIANKHKQTEIEQEYERKRKQDLETRTAQALSDKRDEEHRIQMKIAIDKLRDSDIGRKIIKLMGEEELYKYDPNSLNALHIEHVIKDSREQKRKIETTTS